MLHSRPSNIQEPWRQFRNLSRGGGTRGGKREIDIVPVLAGILGHHRQISQFQLVTLQAGVVERGPGGASDNIGGLQRELGIRDICLDLDLDGTPHGLRGLLDLKEPRPHRFDLFGDGFQLERDRAHGLLGFGILRGGVLRKRVDGIDGGAAVGESFDEVG